MNNLIGFEEKRYAVVRGLNLGVIFIMPNHHPIVAQVIAEGINNLIIQKGEQPIARINKVDLDAQAAKDRRIFTANDAGPKNRDRTGIARVGQDRVTIQNARVGKINVNRVVGPCAGGDHEVVSLIAAG